MIQNIINTLIAAGIMLVVAVVAFLVATYVYLPFALRKQEREMQCRRKR